MNGINTTMNRWVAVTKGGSVLSYGNPNEHLSYHIEDLSFSTFYRGIIAGYRRRDIMEHIKKWNKQCGNENFKCKPIKVSITVKEIKKGESK